VEYDSKSRKLIVAAATESAATHVVRMAREAIGLSAEADILLSASAVRKEGLTAG
jgi:hypothetical protein